MGSSRPNLARRFCRTSAGTLALVASSSNGSPGARARIVNSTRLIPTRTGIEISTRRIRYFDIPETEAWTPSRPPPAPLRLLPPVGQIPEVRVPPALPGIAQANRDGGHARPPDDGDDHDVLDDEVVHLDEEGRALDRIHLGLGGLPGPIVLLVAPPGRVAPRPLVLLRGDFPRRELVHEALRVGLGHGGLIHLEVGVKVEVGVRVGGVG